MTLITRLRRILLRIKMGKMRVTICGIIIFSCVVTAIYYKWYRLQITNNKHNDEIIFISTKSPLKSKVVIKKITPFVKIIQNGKEDRNTSRYFNLFKSENVHQAKLINTFGCKIPKAVIDYAKYIKKHPTNKVSCGQRAVTLSKIYRNTVLAKIDNSMLTKYLKNKHSYYDCCYQFIQNTVTGSSPTSHPKLIFSHCTKFNDNSRITLKTDFINIQCFEYLNKNVANCIYDDFYAFVTKIKDAYYPLECDMKYNVLMIGMDSMSLNRARQTLPRTTRKLQTGFWSSYRGYHKVADNTFPNLMAVFTGKNLTTLEKQCYGNMDYCNRFMIWSRFKEAGYVTAYGEDYVNLPDTFTNEYKFDKPPTDHYMRQFFLQAEHRRKNSTFLCAGKLPSGKQILNYAMDFATTYGNESFFGMFWINSFSHDAKSRPDEADTMLEDFFEELTSKSIILNTFVIFLSDHGIRFGGQRFKMEAYYDDRLPMLFMWIPIKFKQQYPQHVTSMLINQYRLITPYDIYSTLLYIKQISICSKEIDFPAEDCPKCHSVAHVMQNDRLCSDVGISDKWCSCHKMFPLPTSDTVGKNIVNEIVKYVTDMGRTIKTKPCWNCMKIRLKTILRIHFYYSKDYLGLYYVAALTMAPGNTSYEATVYKKFNSSYATIVGPVNVISNYRGLGKCTKTRRDRLFCICQKISNCNAH